MRFSVTTTTAVLACLGMAAAYVGVLYTLPRSIRRLPRDHPTHDESSISFAAWLGIRYEGLLPAVVLPLLITALLFLGSLLANALRLLNVSKQFHSNGLWFAIKNSALYYSVTRDQLPSLRNYILGPLTEEFVFRSCMIPLLVCADFSVKQIVWGSPLTFGVAHLHHFVEHLRNGRSPKDAALIVFFQLFYTSLFGAYASFMYLRTGHFVSIFVVHVFCNIMGFPDISFFNPENSLHPFRIMILGAYFVGIYGFTRVLGPWTDPAIYSSELWNATTSFREPEFEFGGY
ncbi:Prenyl protein protease, partial [Globisporangium splendens]